jgi:formylglycine-generating enzyme required for sulfatase activity
MKNILFILLIFQPTWAIAQSVSQVEISQIGKTMVVEYVLEAIEAQEILLYLSQDGGVTFSKPLEKVSGDIGRGVLPGKKRIVWNVLEEIPELVGDNVVFLVQIADATMTETKYGRPKMEWVLIPVGTFIMGSPDHETDRELDESPQQEVRLNQFKMSKYEVTFDQYDAFCEATGRQKPDDFGWGRGNRPAINLDWNDATAFAEWMDCRLPTEAEWEYACRAGTTTPYNSGSTLNLSQANFNKKVGKTMPVGSYPPNAFGLHDMHGNVWEWCSDWYGDYSGSAQTNPKGSSLGTFRVLRGGSWFNFGTFCRSAYRNHYLPFNIDGNVGFRVVAPN